MSMEQEVCKYKTEIESLLNKADSLYVRYDTQSQELITHGQSIQLLTDEKRLSGKKMADMEYRVNLLLSENEKLNKLLADRLTQVERLKNYIDTHEEEYRQSL